ncbi:glycosyltransferase involved in cell wall biosynthesis [Humitalea rosea]|uniref:Glycosyltransferase involved in cell wall biosynthesis n=1 Tax=Humitalea rosea TaxID=990373 RepID=A0A2W7INK7_9PROT|nr:glycosyltransferase family A protein [Humitalea rosea]PZW48634.1 glycosyltransferase involved in cell wall biosynthesis [Humitalea rosea]
MRRGAEDNSGAARVSVVVPLYNHAAYITPAIESILTQGSWVRQVVVIDDGSTDDSVRVMQELAARDPRIAFRTQANQGAHATINAALRDCDGEFLTILNSDDVYLPGRFAALVGLLDADAGADLAASGIAFMDGNGRSIANAWHGEALAFHRAGHDIGTALVNGNFLMTTSNFLFRRSLFERIGEFAALRYTHDLDFALRAVAFGHRIAMLETPLLRYRLHGSNTISEDHRKVRAEWAISAAAYLTSLLDRPGADAPDWARAADVEEVLQRHGLSRAVHLCMAYLRRHGAGTLVESPLLGDTDFRGQIAGWV